MIERIKDMNALLPLRMLPVLFLLVGLSALGQESAALVGKVWMLDGIAVTPANEALKTQIGRTHPIGRFFLECRADASFALMRGDEAQHAGKWSVDGKTLTLQRQDEAGRDVEKPLLYRVDEVTPTRLLLSVVLPEGFATVRLELSPAQWPRR
jgi:hypothetical protein